MKKILFLALLCLSIPYTHAQFHLISAFNSTHSGRNVSLSLSKNFGPKNEVGIGMRYNINREIQPDNQGNIYMKRLYATEFLHRWGITGYYQCNIIPQWKWAKPFLFYDIQATYSTTKTRMFIPFAYDGNGDVLYKEDVVYFGPFYWVEQTIGFGFRANISKSFFLNQKLGAGACFIIGEDEKLWRGKFDWEFGGLISIGLGYTFNSKLK